ncbi:hypothetical protein HYFRA_00011161 [Hymenoscyphus fraxineus]|uniref:Uncharacterized protein n=1 Tax=Hymenoscyphus fraxineus TaxID=746836 RepID=A0A9N9L4B4_9HELO|nr:hypothetical protein HYFRA_00011161 [Hymenoscyphus fraxineus]
MFTAVNRPPTPNIQYNAQYGFSYAHSEGSSIIDLTESKSTQDEGYITDKATEPDARWMIPKGRRGKEHTEGITRSILAEESIERISKRKAPPLQSAFPKKQRNVKSPPYLDTFQLPPPAMDYKQPAPSNERYSSPIGRNIEKVDFISTFDDKGIFVLGRSGKKSQCFQSNSISHPVPAKFQTFGLNTSNEQQPASSDHKFQQQTVTENTARSIPREHPYPISSTYKLPPTLQPISRQSHEPQAELPPLSRQTKCVSDRDIQAHLSRRQFILPRPTTEQLEQVKNALHEVLESQIKLRPIPQNEGQLSTQIQKHQRSQWYYKGELLKAAEPEESFNKESVPTDWTSSLAKSRKGSIATTNGNEQNEARLQRLRAAESSKHAYLWRKIDEMRF